MKLAALTLCAALVVAVDVPGELAAGQAQVGADSPTQLLEGESDGLQPGQSPLGSATAECYPSLESAETAEPFEDIDQRLGEFPGEVRALIVQDGEVLLQRQAGDPAPVASTAKLYVLLAVVNAIEDGEASWNDALEVTEDLRSLPAGTLQDQQEGYETTLFDVAHRMVEISDNTATDMLVDYIGRSEVEAAVAQAGHHDPAKMTPFLKTREMFQLRWGHPELGEDWEAGDEQRRRSILEDVAQLELEIESADAGASDVNFAIDWHASACDVAAVHEELAQRLSEHPELESILGRNSGLNTQVAEPWWHHLGFKGGSVPGVLTGSWHAVGEDGQERSVVLLLEDDDAEEIREASQEFFSLAADALEIDD